MKKLIITCNKKIMIEKNYKLFEATLTHYFVFLIKEKQFRFITCWPNVCMEPQSLKFFLFFKFMKSIIYYESILNRNYSII